MFRDDKLAGQEKEYADLKDRYEAERKQRLDLEKRLEKYSSVPKEQNIFVKRGLWLFGVLATVGQAVIHIPIFFFQMIVRIVGDWIFPVLAIIILLGLYFATVNANTTPRFRGVSSRTEYPTTPWYP